jgi:hypothetical protein
VSCAAMKAWRGSLSAWVLEYIRSTSNSILSTVGRISSRRLER